MDFIWIPIQTYCKKKTIGLGLVNTNWIFDDFKKLLSFICDNMMWLS